MDSISIQLQKSLQMTVVSDSQWTSEQMDLTHEEVG